MMRASLFSNESSTGALRAHAHALALACVLALVGVAACDKKPPPPAPTPTTQQAADTAKDLTLPKSTGNASPPEPSTVLLVSARELRLAGDAYRIAEIPPDPAQGLADEDKRAGRNDFWITPLEHALRGSRGGDVLPAPTTSAAPSGPVLVVIADERTTYRVLSEIVFTAHRAGMGATLVAAKNGDRLVALPIVTPSQSKLGVRAETRAMLLVGNARLADQLEPPVFAITKSGIGVRVGTLELGPGCAPDQEGFAVPRRNAEYDFTALGACVKKLKDATQALRDETTVLVGAEPGTELQVIVRTMDAMRASFPDVALLVPRSPPSTKDGGAQ